MGKKLLFKTKELRKTYTDLKSGLVIIKSELDNCVETFNITEDRKLQMVQTELDGQIAIITKSIKELPDKSKIYSNDPDLDKYVIAHGDIVTDTAEVIKNTTDLIADYVIESGATIPDDFTDKMNQANKEILNG